MSPKKPTAEERLKQVAKSVASTEPSPKKPKKPKTIKFKRDGTVDNRSFNEPPVGGRNAGGIALRRRIRRQEMMDQIDEEVTVTTIDKKTGKQVTVRMKPVRVQIKRLFDHGVKSWQAVDSWLDRAVGKVPIAVVGDDEEPPVQMQQTFEIVKKAYGQGNDGSDT